MPMACLVVIALVFQFIGVHAQTRRNASYEQCRAQIVSLQAAIQKAHKDRAICTRIEDFKVDFGWNCSFGNLTRRYGAWPQCDHYEQLRCEKERELGEIKEMCSKLKKSSETRTAEDAYYAKKHITSDYGENTIVGGKFFQLSISKVFRKYANELASQFGSWVFSDFNEKNYHRFVKETIGIDIDSWPYKSVTNGEDEKITDFFSKLLLSRSASTNAIQRIWLEAIQTHIDDLEKSVAATGDAFDAFVAALDAATPLRNSRDAAPSASRERPASNERRQAAPQPSQSCFNILDSAIASNNISGSARACWDKAINEAPIGCESLLRMWRGQSGGDPARAREQFRAKCQ